MKKNSLTTAVVAGVVGVAGLANVATAVNINPDGLGQVLIYPYYTVNDNATLISVVNTTDEVKAVKVRFLEAKNSREVLDFNLYLSPFDVWTAAILSSTDDNSGPGFLITEDNSCTVPRIPAAGVEFRNFAYTGAFNDDAEDNLARTREGHIEMIEMGVVDEAVSAAATGFEVDAIHDAGVPFDCPSLVTSWTSGTWAANGAVDVRGPTGGLFGGAVIVDGPNGTALSYNADAISGFYQLNNANLHTRPGSTFPSLSQAQTSVGEADAIVFDNGALITLDFASGTPNAVSSVFMHDALYNEYNVDPGLLAASEWVMTFPTKRLHIESATAAARLPFANDSNGGGDGLQFDASGYCEPILVEYYDREEATPVAPPSDIDFSPEPPEDTPLGTNLCWEANVITFNQSAQLEANGVSEILGSRNAFNIDLEDGFEAGWIAMGVGDDSNFLLDGDATDGVTPRNQIFGLPVTGFWAANFVNAQAAPNTLANYSVTSKHRASFTANTVTVAADGTITDTGFAAS